MKDWLAKVGLWAVAGWVVMCLGLGLWMAVWWIVAVADHAFAIVCWAGFIVLGCLVKWGWRKWVG